MYIFIFYQGTFLFLFEVFLIVKSSLFIGLSDNMYDGRSLPLFLPHIYFLYMWGYQVLKEDLMAYIWQGLPDI